MNKSIQKNYRRSYHLTIFLSLLLLSYIPNAVAGEILKSLSYSVKENKVEIKASFGAQVTYVKHFPLSRGKIIQIQVQVDKKAFNEEAQQRRETLSGDVTAPVSLKDVIYEGNVRGGPYLVLRFDEVVTFSLGKESGEKFLTVVVNKDEPAPVVVAPAPVIESGQSTSSGGDASANNDAEKLLLAGRQALTRGDNNDAIFKLSDLLAMPDNPFQQDAKEYLGLARERNNQLDMAKKEYEEYLKLYEKSPKASTVRQRLMTLNARIEDAERKLKEGKRQQEAVVGGKRIDKFGRFSTNYYRSVNKVDGQSLQSTSNRLLTFGDYNYRQRSEIDELRLVASGSLDYNFEPDADSLSANKEREFRLRTLLAEYKNKEKRYSAILGRQSINSGGVLGRVDALLLGYDLKPNIRAYAVGGVTVDYQDNMEFQKDRPIFGGRLDFDDLVKDWKGSVYGIEQRIDGILDRRAVGGDVRYFQNQKMFFTFMDYDLSYKVLNFATAHYGWSYDQATKFDIHADYRLSPVLLTYSAVTALGNAKAESLGLPSGTDLTELKANPTIRNMRDLGVSEATIRQLALENTGKSVLLTFGMTRDFTADVNFNGTLTYSRYEASPAIRDETISRNPLDESNIDTENYSVAGQLTRRNWFVSRDIALAGVRYSQDARSKQASGNITLRWPYQDKWSFDTRGRLLYNTGGVATAEIRLTPTVRVEYRINRDMTVEAELSTDVSYAKAQKQYSYFTYGNGGIRYMF